MATVSISAAASRRNQETAGGNHCEDRELPQPEGSFRFHDVLLSNEDRSVAQSSIYFYSASSVGNLLTRQGETVCER